jgi:hypothetical protein
MDWPMKNIAWLAALALLESLQLIIVVALFYSFIPIPPDHFYSTIFPFFSKGLFQKRDMFFYRIFVGTAIGLQTAFMFFYRKYLNDEESMPKVRAWMVMAVVVLIPQLFLIYQAWLGPHPEQARQALCVVCALAIAVRVFWPEVYSWAKRLKLLRLTGFRFPDRRAFDTFWKNYQDPMVLFLLVSAISIQVYLDVFAAHGWLAHLPIWPSNNTWNFILLGIICLTVGGSAVVIYAHQGMLKGFKKRHAARAMVEGLLSFFLLNALFEIHVYYYQPQLAGKAYVVLLTIALIVKIGWTVIKRFLRAVDSLLMNEKNLPALRMMANALFIVFIFLFLFVPDLEAAIARVFMGEQFHSIDACLMNTGWAYHAGCKLDVDVNNRYGLGMAVMTSQLSNLFGGFTYLNVYTIVMLACIFYFIAAYGLLRWWLNSVPIAIAGILIFLKMQPFHEETSSFYLSNPSTTVCRFFFDLPCLFMILMFLRTLRKPFLLAAAFICSIALFYALDTGVYLSAAYYALLVLTYFLKDIRDKIYAGSNRHGLIAALILIPPLGGLALLRLTQGGMVFTPLFWQNMMEYIHSQLWYGPVHIWESLSEHDPWLFGMGMWIIAAYVFTLIFVGSLIFLRKVNYQHLFVVVLCVYGLSLYHYYINRSSPTNCYRGILPYVFICCFWVQILVKRMSRGGRKKFYLFFLGICLYGLWTTHLTLAYPNMFNFSRNPSIDPMVAPKLSEGRLAYFNQLFIQYPDAFKLPVNSLGETFEDWRTEDDFSSDEQLKEYFRQEFNFPEDAALIDEYAQANEPVALISSFEIQILIQANRRPFFYIFPLVNSRPMRMRLFEVTHMWTTTQMNDTIKQLEDKKPAFVFMERIYLAPVIPQAYLYDMPPVCALVNYVREHYEPYKIGKYLVAMKLRTTP